MPHKLGKVKHARATPINKKKKTFVKTQLASTLLLNGWSTTCIFCKFSLLFLYFKKFNHSPTRRMSDPALDHILSQSMKLSKRNKINLFLRLRNPLKAREVYQLTHSKLLALSPTIYIKMTKQVYSQASLTTFPLDSSKTFTSLIVDPATLCT